MALAAAFIIFFLFAISFYRFKSLLSPIVFINALYLVIVFGSSIGLYGMRTENDNAAFLVLLGIIGLNIGFYLVSHDDKLRNFNPSKYRIRENLLKFYLITLGGFSLYYFILASSLIAMGYSLNMIRLFYFSDDALNEVTGVVQSPIVVYGTVYLYTPVQYVMLALTSIVLVDKSFLIEKKFYRKAIVIITISNIVIAMITNGGRMILYYFFATYLSMLVLRNSKSIIRILFGKKNIKYLFFAISLMLVANYVTQERSEEGNANVLRSLYVYFCGCIPNLEINMAGCKPENYTNGFVLISSFVRPIFTAVNFIFHNGVPEIFKTVDDALFYASNTNELGPGIKYNAFVTMFYFLYADSGLFGVVIGSLLIGFVLGILYKNRNNNILSLVFFLLAMQGVSISFIRLQTVSVGYALAFYYAKFLVAKRKL